MKALLSILLAFWCVMAGAQVLEDNALEQRITSNFYTEQLPVDTTPTYVISGEVGRAARIPVESIDLGYNTAAYASGTTYNLTASYATINFSIADPVITLAEPGTYLILAGANLKYEAATFATTQFASFLIRRSNNTPANLSNSDRTITLRIITTITDHAGTVIMPPLIYSTETSGDMLELQGKLSATPSAGSLTVTSSEIIAIRIL